ncbi:hypothetical protein [Halorubrum depositum]|uniref:hypothetical protein n=1 Tax=Halorubrum depositum TaxID=2583992 RepID=UPI00119E9A4D|nr:hypothetical protein [Halorubrum depositum]
MNRRQYLTTIGASSVITLAGCSGDTSEGNGGEETDPEGGTDSDSEDESTNGTNGGSTNDDTSDGETEPEPTHEYVPDPWSNLEETDDETSATVTGEATLGEGQYAVRQAQFQRTYNLEISVSVQGGGEIDILGMSADEFDRYRGEEQPVTYDGYYEEGVSETTISGQLPEGDHRFIFDNSGVFGSEPDGEVTFEFETVVSL